MSDASANKELKDMGDAAETVKAGLADQGGGSCKCPDGQVFRVSRFKVGYMRVTTCGCGVAGMGPIPL